MSLNPSRSPLKQTAPSPGRWCPPMLQQHGRPERDGRLITADLNWGTPGGRPFTTIMAQTNARPEASRLRSIIIICCLHYMKTTHVKTINGQLHGSDSRGCKVLLLASFQDGTPDHNQIQASIRKAVCDFTHFTGFGTRAEEWGALAQASKMTVGFISVQLMTAEMGTWAQLNTTHTKSKPSEG